MQKDEERDMGPWQRGGIARAHKGGRSGRRVAKAGISSLAKSPWTWAASLALVLGAWGATAISGQPPPGGIYPLQDPTSQSRKELLNPPALDSLAPPLTTLEPSPAALWSRSIERLIDEGKLEEAQAKLTKASPKQDENLEVLYLQAKIHFKAKRFLDSLKTLQRCLTLRQDDPRVFVLVASNGLLLGRADISEPALKSAIRLRPAAALPRFQLGALYYTESHFQDAARELGEAVKLQPEFMQAHVLLGATLEELEDRDGALRSYGKGIELAERRKLQEDQPYLFVGRFLARLNRVDEGLPYLQKAVEINPGSSEALYLIGKILSTQGRDPEAIETLLKSAQSNPQYPEPHYLLSRIYQKLGRSEQAQEEFQLFQKLKREEKIKDDGRRSRPQNPAN